MVEQWNHLKERMKEKPVSCSVEVTSSTITVVYLWYFLGHRKNYKVYLFSIQIHHTACWYVHREGLEVLTVDTNRLPRCARWIAAADQDWSEQLWSRSDQSWSIWHRYSTGFLKPELRSGHKRANCTLVILVELRFNLHRCSRNSMRRDLNWK